MPSHLEPSAKCLIAIFTSNTHLKLPLNTYFDKLSNPSLRSDVVQPGTEKEGRAQRKLIIDG